MEENRLDNVTIEFKGVFREVTRKSLTKVNCERGMTIRDVIVTLESRFGEEFADMIKLRDYVIILVNGSDCRKYKDLETSIKKGDKLSISHIVAGG